MERENKFKKPENQNEQQQRPIPDWLKKDIEDRNRKRLEELNLQLKEQSGKDEEKLKKIEESLEQKESEIELLNRALEESGIYILARFGDNIQEGGEYNSFGINLLVDDQRPIPYCHGLKDGIKQAFSADSTRLANQDMNTQLGIRPYELNPLKIFNQDRNQINEFLDIRHVRALEKRRVPGKKGFFGIGKTPDTIEEFDSDRILKHNEMVINGKDEPVVRFNYVFHSPDYQDFSGRPGKELKVDFLLPESTAKELEKLIDRNPALLRKLIEKAIKEKLLKDPTDWDRKGDSKQEIEEIRPPWENHNKIYIQKEGGKQRFQEDCFQYIQ